MRAPRKGSVKHWFLRLNAYPILVDQMIFYQISSILHYEIDFNFELFYFVDFSFLV